GFVCLLALSPLSSLASAQNNRAGKCTEALERYEGYTVREVRIDSPLGWLFGSVDQQLTEILSDPSLPIQQGRAFHRADLTDSFIKVKDSFPELQVSPFTRIAVRIARLSIENCDE